jgi:hypothetical protein
MPTKLMMIFVGMDFLFAGCGGLLLGFSLLSEQSLRNSPTVNNVTQNVLLGQCPLTGTTASYRNKRLSRASILRHYCGASRDTHHWMAQYMKKNTDDCVAGVVNAIFVFVTFLLSLPAMFLPTNRGWLRTQGWLVVVCATFTLGLGIAIWLETLETRRNLSVLWGRETPLIQSLLQQKVSTLHKHCSKVRPNIGTRGRLQELGIAEYSGVQVRC